MRWNLAPRLMKAVGVCSGWFRQESSHSRLRDGASARRCRIAAGRVPLAASHLSMIRTIIICVVALALGLASRRRHIELRWIAYAAVALGTLKLLLEDLRFGNPASLVVSFVFYGLILILLPRLTILR